MCDAGVLFEDVQVSGGRTGEPLQIDQTLPLGQENAEFHAVRIDDLEVISAGTVLFVENVSDVEVFVVHSYAVHGI